MRFSVVIPLFRSHQTLKRAITSVLAQTLPAYEIILIVDDGDDYQAFVTDARIRLLSTERVGAGAGIARNIGFDAARGDAIALLDADDAFHPRRLEILAPLIEKYGAAFSATRYVDDATGAELPNINYLFNKDHLAPMELLLSSMHTLVHIAFDRKRCPVRNDVSHAAQDTVLGAKLYDYVDAVGYSALPLYDYHRNERSFCTQAGSARTFHDFILDVLDPASPAYAKISQYKAFETVRLYLATMLDAERLIIDNPDVLFQDTMLALVQKNLYPLIKR